MTGRSTEKEVIEYYNQRGRSEKVFDIMNNDFGWNKMPFSFMQENTVFLVAMAMCKNLYKYLIEKFSKAFKGLKKNFRLKKFIFRFITVAGKWIKQGRQKTLKLYTEKPYGLVFVLNDIISNLKIYEFKKLNERGMRSVWKNSRKIR